MLAVGLEVAAQHQGGIIVGGWRLFATYAAWWVAFLVAAGCLLRIRRGALPLLLLGTVVLQLVGLVAGPQLSDDLYRYSWDGKVQAAGIDPYRYPPTDPHLDRLHDRWLWPDAATCRGLGRPAGCTRINRAGERTIYPPVAEGYFLLLHEVTPAGARERGQQVPQALLGIGLVVLLVAALRRLGRDPRLAVWYAWSPLAVAETAMEGHVDVLGVLFAIGGLLALHRRRAGLGALLVGAAALVKVYPLLLAPVALRRRPVRAAAVLVGLVALAYTPHVLAVGTHVLGYLPGYLNEEGYTEGRRFLLLGLLGLSGLAAKLVVGLVLAVVAISVLRDRARPPAELALRMLGAAWLLATPAAPWYSLLLVAVAVLAGAPEWLAVAAAGYPVYFAALLREDATTAGRISYGLAAVFVLVIALRRHRREPARLPSTITGRSSLAARRPHP